MKLMSFSLTTPQILARTKTVTRRLGWKAAKVGDVVQPIEKGQGLKKGETVTRIGVPIRFVQVDREPLNYIYGRRDDTAREGFPELNGAQFVEMFCKHKGCAPSSQVTRIEFEYVVDGDVR